VFTTSATFPWSFVTQIFHRGQRGHGADRKTFEVLLHINGKFTMGKLKSSLLS